MATIQETLNSARQLAVMFKAMSTISDKLEELGSIENYEMELRAAVEKLKAETDAATASRDAAVAGESEAISAVHGKIAEMEEAAELAALSKANAIVAEAQDKATAIVGNAEQRFSDLRELTRVADESAAASQAAAATAAAELAAIERALSSAKANLAKLIEA